MDRRHNSPLRDVFTEGEDFDGEVFLAGGVEVTDGDDAVQGGAVAGVGDGDVADGSLGHDLAGVLDGCARGAGDEITGHDLMHECLFGIEALRDDAGEDVALGDDARDMPECVGDDERADAVLVHQLRGLKDGAALPHGVDDLEGLCFEELRDGVHDRFLSRSTSGRFLQSVLLSVVWPVWKWPVVLDGFSMTENLSPGNLQPLHLEDKAQRSRFLPHSGQTTESSPTNEYPQPKHKLCAIARRRTIISKAYVIIASVKGNAT